MSFQGDDGCCRRRQTQPARPRLVRGRAGRKLAPITPGATHQSCAGRRKRNGGASPSGPFARRCRCSRRSRSGRTEGAGRGEHGHAQAPAERDQGATSICRQSQPGGMRHQPGAMWTIREQSDPIRITQHRPHIFQAVRRKSWIGTGSTGGFIRKGPPTRRTAAPQCPKATRHPQRCVPIRAMMTDPSQVKTLQYPRAPTRSNEGGTTHDHQPRPRCRPPLGEGRRLAARARARARRRHRQGVHARGQPVVE